MTRISHSVPVPDVTAESETFWQRLEQPPSPSRRRAPRVHANVAMRVMLTAEEGVNLCTNDLSLYGLQVRCDFATATRLSADTQAAEPPSHPLRLTLLMRATEVHIRAVGRICHVTPIPGAPDDQSVAIGFALSSFEGRDDAVLQRFVEQHLEPA